MKTSFFLLSFLLINFLSAQVGGLFPDQATNAETAGSLDSCTNEFLFDPIQMAPMGIHVRGKDCWVIGHQGDQFSFPVFLSLVDLSTPNFDTIFTKMLPDAIVGDVHVQADTLWYVEEETSTLRKVNAYTGEEIAQFFIPNVTQNIWGITGTGDALLINEYGTGLNSSIYRFDYQSEQITDTLTVAAPSMLGIVYVDGKIYGSEPFGIDSLLIIDPATGQIEGSVPWCIPSSYGITFDVVSNSFYGCSGNIFGGTGDVYGIQFDSIVSSVSTAPFQEIPLTLSPNPVMDVLSVQVDLADDYQLTLFDAAGRQVSQRKQYGEFFSMGTQGLKPGIYYLQVRNAKGLSTQKFIKR